MSLRIISLLDAQSIYIAIPGCNRVKNWPHILQTKHNDIKVSHDRKTKVRQLKATRYRQYCDCDAWRCDTLSWYEAFGSKARETRSFQIPVSGEAWLQKRIENTTRTYKIPGPDHQKVAQLEFEWGSWAGFIPRYETEINISTVPEQHNGELWHDQQTCTDSGKPFEARLSRKGRLGVIGPSHYLWRL